MIQVRLRKLAQNQGKWIWERRDAYEISELAKQGKSVPEIAEVVKWREDTVWNFIRSPTFLKKLEVHPKSVFFEFQRNKVLALEEISKLFWNVIMDRKQVEGLIPDQASKHLVKILSLKEREPKVINPKQYNLIRNVFKTEPEKIEDIAEHFGFADL